MNEQFILNLMEKFSTLNMAALELTIEDSTLCLQKDAAFAPTKIVQHGAPFQHFATAQPILATPVCTPPASDENMASTGSAAPAVVDSTTAIKSPIVGTFYRSPSPDSPAYAEAGKTIKKGQPLCILEAMKMMNTLEAEFDCIIEKIFASNGDLIEFDQTLFQVRKI